MKQLRTFFAAVLPLLSACSGIDVQVDQLGEPDLSNHQTYCWASKPAIPAVPAAAEQIVAEIEGQLNAKGWRKVAEGRGDVAIAAHVTTRKQERIDPVLQRNMGYGWLGPSWNSNWTGVGLPGSRTTYFTVGTLVVDIFDAKSGQGEKTESFWHGIAAGTVSSDPQENQRRISEAVGEMFKDFPPSATGAGAAR